PPAPPCLAAGVAPPGLGPPPGADPLAPPRGGRAPSGPVRTLTRRLGWLLVLEATRDLATDPIDVPTPLETTSGQVITERLVAIPVLRAGLGLLDAATDLYPDTVVGYLGMERDEITLQPRDYYAKLPPMEGRRALVLDPMLATGGSGTAALTHIKANAGPRSI